MIRYFIKYYIYNGSTKLFRSSFILPLTTIFIGCFVMMMSFAIMEGFSKEISDTIYFFDKEHSLTINKKEFLNHYNSKHLDSLIFFLRDKNYFFNSYEDRLMFINNKEVARVYGIDYFDNFKPNQFLIDNFSNQFYKNNIDYCYLGYNQSMNLGIISGDTINLLSILDFQNTSSFPKRNFDVKGIIKTNIPRYDNSLFIPMDSLLFSKNIFLNINLKNAISKGDLAILNSKFKKGLSYNRDVHLFSELLYAINYEKLFYAFFGLFIVLISSVMLMGFNISSIITNISSIGLLELLGLKRWCIGLFYILYTFSISIIGFFVAFLLFQFILTLDNNYQLMSYIFDPSVYFSFNLQLSNYVVVRILFFTIVIMLLSTLYPLYKISKLDIIESIKSKG